MKKRKHGKRGKDKEWLHRPSGYEMVHFSSFVYVSVVRGDGR